jgi:hypothetical protein
MSEKTVKLKAALAPALEIISSIFERAYANGDRRALFKTLQIHFSLEMPVPLWAQRAFTRACRADPKSWDEVLGPPPEPTSEVVMAFDAGQRLRRDRGLAVGDALFEALAKELKTSAATAKRRYYKHPAFRPGNNAAQVAKDHLDHLELAKSGTVADEDIKYCIALDAFLLILSLLRDRLVEDNSQEAPQN